MSGGIIRSPGTQQNPKGFTQGNTLVDPNTGKPITVIEETDGSRRLAVDANLSADSITVDTRDLSIETDNVAVGDKASGNFLKVNNDGSIDTNTLLNASEDNVAIADATTGFKLKVNADGSINTGATASATPTIFNVPVPSANTEVSQALPANTKQFTLRVRDSSSTTKLAYVSGQSGTNYITIGRGVVYSQDNVSLPSTTLYFQLDKSGKTVEILAWN